MMYGVRTMVSNSLTILVAVFLSIPFATLLFDLLINGVTHFPMITLGARHGTLFLNSAMFSAGTTVFGLLIVIPAASILIDISGRTGAICRLLAVSPIAVPSYLHALAWQQFFESMGLSGQHAVVSFCVETFTHLPLLLAAALIGFSMIGSLPRDAASLYANPAKALLSISLPQARTAILAGASITFIFSINEYALPALFQRHTYALEIFAEYSVTANTANTLTVALPLLTLSVISAFLAINAVRYLPSQFSMFGTRRPVLSGQPIYDALRLAALFIVFCQLLVPLWKTVGILSAADMMSSVSSHSSLITSILAAMATTLVTIPLAWLLAESLSQHKVKLLWVLIALGIALPPSLTGAGAIRFGQWTGMEFFYSGWGLAIFGMTLHLLPLSTLLIYAVAQCIDPLPWDAARLHRNGIALWLSVRLRQLWPGLLGTGLLCFALSLTDLELSLLLWPPGSTSIGVRLFNYLHYGAVEQIAYLSFLLLIMTVLVGSLFYYLLTLPVSQTDYTQQRGGLS